MLGNHDYWPADNFPAHANPIYNFTSEFWKSWLQGQALFQPQTLSNYGYYKIGLDSNVTLFALNTNLYYIFDKAGDQFGADPGNQFQWLENGLKQVRQQNDTAIVIGHISPGAFERTPNITWFRPQYNKRMTQILLANSDIISMNLFGHDHTDSFRILCDRSGLPISYILLAPAVTPWRSTLPGAGANNPGFRLIDYDPSNWTITDVRQYYINLTEANSNTKPEWKLEYSFNQAYQLRPSGSITALDLDRLVKRFQMNDTLFQQYFRYNSVGFDSHKCLGECKVTQLCAIKHVDYPSYYHCLTTGSTTPAPTTPAPSNGAIKLAGNVIMPIWFIQVGIGSIVMCFH